MKLSVLVSATALLAVALTLTGCTHPVPPGPSGAELEAYNQRILDRTWINSGLDGIEQRPDVPRGESLDREDWDAAYVTCMVDAGFDHVGLGFSISEGFSLAMPNGASGQSPEELIAFYRCVAAHPLARVDNVPIYSEAQLDYVYDYYRDWLVPCLRSEGYVLSQQLSRLQFATQGGQWSPYWSLVEPLSDSQYSALVTACGPERPALG